ncbi:thioesterase domain-containing protein [Micromonospora sp. NPDC003197]
MNWFASTNPRPAARTQLFCLPYAGAGASAFRGWQDEFGPDVEVLPVQLPGREHRIMEDPRFTIAEVATVIAQRADRPYAIYGHSMGGRVGFEVVRELRRTGRTLPRTLYVGGARAPHVESVSLFDGLSKVDDEELLRRLAASGSLPAEFLDSPELVELLLPLLRADFGRVDDYTYLPEAPLPVPIVAFSGRTDRAVTLAESQAWAGHTGAGFTLYELDAGHFFLHDVRTELINLLRADLVGQRTTGQRTTGQRATGQSTTGQHRIPLGDTGWSIWRDAILRSTGFPADGLTLLSAPRAAAAADEFIATGAGAELLGQELAAALCAGGEQLREIAASPLLREAIIWQNPDMLVSLDGLIRGGGNEGVRSSKQRKRERALLKYWQRYCGKNETVGFFGPSCWVTVDPAVSQPAVVTPGPDLVRRRRVFFESWALAAYAESLSRDPAVRRWWAPMLQPHFSLVDRQVLRPGRPPVTVPAVEAALLAACDGRRPAVEIVADPTLGLRRPEDGYTLLDNFVERELITWDAGLPVSPEAESSLRERIEAIGDETARAAARTGLDRLCAARDQVADAAGDPDTLRTALSVLDEVFTELTGLPPRRRSGQMYAGRTLCYEDTHRDLDATFGAALLDELAEPLGVLLQAARWMVGALHDAYSAVLRDLYDELRTEAGDGQVALSELWFLTQGMFWGTGKRPVDDVAAEFARRWAGLFGLDALPPGTTSVEMTSADLAGRVAEVFPARHPGWAAGLLHSPDLQICATDGDALARGDYTVVLGELHAGWASFDCAALTVFHPDSGRLVDALADDLGERRVRLLFPTDWPRRTSRVAESLAGPTDRLLAFTAAPGGEPDRLLSTSDLTVSEVAGQLVATARDGQQWPLIEIFANLLSTHAVDGFKLVAAAPYTPRITIDRLVVARATWRTTIGATGLLDVIGESERFLAVRRWRRQLGLPEQVYMKLSTETKPCFVDLSSPFYATGLCSMLRTARDQAGEDVSLVLSEMLPTPDQAWVPDAQGRRYFSELRLHIFDETVGGR